MGFSDGNNTYSNPKSKVQPNLAKAVPAPIKILAHRNLRTTCKCFFCHFRSNNFHISHILWMDASKLQQFF